MPCKPFLSVRTVRHVPATPTHSNEVCHWVLFISCSGSSFGMRVRHAKPHHTDDTARHVASALGADSAGLGIAEDAALMVRAGGSG